MLMDGKIQNNEKFHFFPKLIHKYFEIPNKIHIGDKGLRRAKTFLKKNEEGRLNFTIIKSYNKGMRIKPLQ